MPPQWRAVRQIVTWLAAAGGPVLLTAILLRTGRMERDYVFLYLGLVAILGIFEGLWPTLLAATASFLLVDYFFVPPVGSLTIADEQDLVNLLAFLFTSSALGLLTSLRRRALLRADALAQQLRGMNTELVRLNKEQAEAAQSALRLAHSQEQVRALRESDRLRRDLLANVSHELRTPLSTILTASTIPLPRRAGRSETEERLGVIAAEAGRLKSLVDDMLEMAVIEAGTLELHLEPIRLADAIEAAVERLHRHSPERDVVWDGERAQVDVFGDWESIGQIMDNLLVNADRFGPAGTPIRVDIDDSDPGLLTIGIRDAGPGVPPELRAKIFDRFVGGEPTDEGGRPVGTGLGLAIAKGLVEAHGGTIALAGTEPGQGATFTFTLPRPAPAE